ncbi:MAG: hypothetical protein GY806_01965 [Gammaproteobacteria bacterium]|nr:hypothetical protein [Gammaproteobacteria bacterium]
MTGLVENNQQSLQVLLNMNPGAFVVYNQHPQARFYHSAPEDFIALDY